MGKICGAIFNGHSTTDPKDTHGCILQEGHAGYHKFIDEDDDSVEWDYDWGCGCDNCCTENINDMCITYLKKRNEKP